LTGIVRVSGNGITPFRGATIRAMKSLLLASVVLLLSGEALASAAAWRERHVVVRDYTPAAWQPHVEATVRAFNDAMPEAVPRLVYARRPERRCRAVRERRGAVALCADDTAELARWWGWAEYRVGRGGVIPSAKVSLWSGMPPGNVADTLCHELMHALTNADHAPFREDSCVRGNLREPGAWDVAFATRVYRQHR
jgi:hypothetical protein